MTEFEQKSLRLMEFINLRLGEIRDELHELNGYQELNDFEDEYREENDDD